MPGVEFDAAAKTGDFDRIKTAVGNLNMLRKACHDNDRNEKCSN